MLLTWRRELLGAGVHRDIVPALSASHAMLHASKLSVMFSGVQSQEQ